jgi:hypothetical protein
MICYNALNEMNLPDRRNKMHPNRKMRREDLEAMLQSRIRQETLAVEDLVEEKLNRLQVFIGQLARTPHGLAEIERRAKRFGDCKQIEGETSGQFYGKLRHWIDRDMPQAKSLLHVPRQSDD